MKHKKYLLTLLLVPTLLLGGCCSSNVRSFMVDPQLGHHLTEKKISSTYIESISKPKDDVNSLMCRMAGNIYLPGKMTYSQYVGDAFTKSLLNLGALANDPATAKHRIKIVLGDISFDTIGGTWTIIGKISVDGASPISVKTVSEYGTAWDAVSACRNTAEAFGDAVSKFIIEVLNDKTIRTQLK